MSIRLTFRLVKKTTHFSGQTLPLKWLLCLAYIEEFKRCIFFPKQKNLFILKTSEVVFANANIFLNPIFLNWKYTEKYSHFYFPIPLTWQIYAPTT